MVLKSERKSLPGKQREKKNKVHLFQKEGIAHVYKAQTEEERAWWPGLLGYHAENIDEQITIFALQNDPCVCSGEPGLQPEQD